MTQPLAHTSHGPLSLKSVGYRVLKALLLAVLGGAALVISVMASVSGFTPLLVLVAIGGLIALTLRQRMRGTHMPHRSRRAVFVTGFVVVWCLVVLMLVGELWGKVTSPPLP